MSEEHYVYVYIDPRNNEEFYFGKGKGSRKDFHLNDRTQNVKTQRINDIKKAGCKPLVRVVARGLSSEQALLVEKTLIWKLGKVLTNDSTGHYSENFRPQNTLHIELPKFDYQRGIYYFNVGECERRNWDDYRNFGFISAGGRNPKWRNAIKGFDNGDVCVAYLKRRKNQGGFVGIGVVSERARPIREVSINGKPLLSLALSCNGMGKNVESDELCEYVAKVEWLASVEREGGKWKKDLYTTPLVRASLEGQSETVDFLETEFRLDLRALTR